MKPGIDVHCRNCQNDFTAPRSQKGGLASCPVCLKAVEVGGGPEPLFWVVLGGVSIAALGLGVYVATQLGLGAGFGVVAFCGAVIAIGVAAS